MSYKTKVTNWGNFPVVESEYFAPRHAEQVQHILHKAEKVIPRGNGRCYGDSALSDNIISGLKLNKILDFDTENGIMTCQAGVLLSEILDVIVPKGFFIPVSPGTKFITVAGAIASDIHGKNHHSEGCFTQHVLNFDIILPDGSQKTCSLDENYELFCATAGGMGLTGFITRVTFRLKPIESAYIRMESIKAKNLDEIMKLFEESGNWTYTMSWIDCLAKGKNLGKSIIMRGEHASFNELPEKYKKAPLHFKEKKKMNVPFYFPSFTLNTLSVKAFNLFYYYKQTRNFVSSVVDYDTFFYPLDSILNWNRIYGKNGFTQYQFVIPKEKSKEGLERILKKIEASGQGSFLAVLKLFGEGNPHSMISFPKEGYTLALDFKISKKVLKLLDELDEIVEELGGRLYLTKDVRMNHALFRHTYQKYPEFKSYIENLKNGTSFTSLQSERVFGK